jgi:hypothetical protein
MAVGGVEVPLGNKDHASGHGPIGEIAAGLFSVEKRPIAGIGYAYYHHSGQYDNGTRQSGNMFTGTGSRIRPLIMMPRDIYSACNWDSPTSAHFLLKNWAGRCPTADRTEFFCIPESSFRRTHDYSSLLWCRCP